MTIHARFLPKYPKNITVTNGLTKNEANGVVTLGFDYKSSEFGAELKQAVNSANADAASASADKVSAETASTAAQGSAAEAESWASLAESAVVNTDASFDLVANAKSATIGASKKAVLTQGYATIGLGAARYRRVASQPTHPGKLRSTDRFAPDGTIDSANGGWWEIAEPIIDARMLGVVSGSNADSQMTDAIATAAALVVPLRIPTGTFQFLKEVNLSPLAGGQLIIDGDVIFDFSSSTEVTDFPDGGFVYVGAGNLSALPALSSDIQQATASLVFSSSPSLVNGDRICIFNPTAGSYSAYRPAYFAGEFVAVSDGSGGTNVKLYGATYAAYLAASVSIYKHPNKKISVTGGYIQIIESRAAGFGGTAGFKAERIVDSDFSPFRPTQSLYAGMALKQCIGIHGTGYHCKMVFPSGGDTCYGMTYANCQDIIIEGDFFGGRHGAAGGGYADVGSVPSRNIRIKGTFRNSPDAPQGIGAVEFHGNCEFCSYSGQIEGGVSIGGNNNNVAGNISTRPSQNGLAIYFGEMVGTNFKIEGRISVSSATLGTPVISIGDLGTTPLNSNTIRGGVLDFSNIVFDCPYSSRLISIQNSGATPPDPMVIDIRGAKWSYSLTTPTHSVLVGKLSGNNFDYLLMDGFVNGPNAPYAISSVSKVRGWRQRVAGTLAPSTSASVATVAVAINAPKKPDLSPANAPTTMGAARAYPIVDAANTSATLATFGMATCDGSSFPSSAGGAVTVIASVDE